MMHWRARDGAPDGPEGEKRDERRGSTYDETETP